MKDELLCAAGDEPERGTDLLRAIEDNMRTVCGLAAESSPRRPKKLTRNHLLLLVTDMEVLRVMASTGEPEHEAREEACLRYDGPEAMSRVREYVAAWNRRFEETRR